MAPDAQWHADAGDGDKRHSEKGVVAVLGRACVEVACLLQNRPGKMRLPGVCRAGEVRTAEALCGDDK